MKSFKLAQTAAALLVLSTGFAQAATVSVWTANIDSTFDPSSIVATDGSPGGVAISNSNRTLRWGTDIGNGQSGLDITNSPISTILATNGAAVANISVTHRNQPIQAPSLDRVNILSTLTLTPFTPLLPGLPATTMTFGINFLETPNGGTDGFCADGAAVGSGGVNSNGCADIFVLDKNSLNFSFFYDTDGAGGDPAQQYFISFFEQTQGLNPLSAAACLATTGVDAPCLGFETPEGFNTTVNFAAVITTREVVINVPEPASLALMGLGLLGLGLSRRKQQQG